jgi:hypothetical protein
VGAGEALTMPGVIAVGHTTLGDHLAALDALSSKFIFVTFSTIDVVLLRDERLCSDRILASATDETLLMPLPCLVLHLLHACSENIATSIAPSSKLGIIASPTIDPVCLASKLFIDQAGSTFIAKEAGLMPVLLFVGQVLRVDADNLVALVAVVSEHIFVALDTVGVIFPQHIPVASKAVVAMVAEHDFYFVILAGACRG